ncbi:retrovirus-related pol polyprotein from transposon TNT 1-94 [Tanacetum coccineum]
MIVDMKTTSWPSDAMQTFPAFEFLLNKENLPALAEENDAVSKESARNGEWVKISMRKVHTLLEIEDNDDRKVCLDYLCIDLNYVEEQRINLLSKHKNLVHELNTCKEQLLVLKQAKLDFLTMQHVNTEILKENKNLRSELKELKEITKTWLNNSNKVNQCISEQIPSQKKKILGVDQLTEDPSSSGQKDLVFVKSSADDTKVTIPGVERPWLSEAEGFILPNHDTGRILLAEYMSTINMSQHLKSLGRASSRPNIPRPSKCFFPPCIHCGGIDHLSNECLYYPICKLCGSYDHDTNGHNRIISLEKEINPRNPQHAFKRCEACGSSNHTITDLYDIEWKPIWYLDNGCSRHMTGVKSYLHKYVEQPGPKVVFGDDSTCTTEGYGFIKYVYVLDMTSSAQESCFFAKASENLNWLWHKRLVHLNFKTFNKLAKQNLVIGLPSLVYSKDKPCSSCEKGKHHRANFKTKQTSSIKKCLHLLHMDLFGPVTPRSINHEKYTLVIVDEYSRYTWVYFLKKKSQAPETIMSFIKRVKNQNDIKVKQLRTDNVYIHNHKDYLGKFDEKADDGYLLGYLLVSKAFRVFNTRRQQTKETYHITFDESPKAIKFSKPSADDINIAEIERYPPDEYLSL